MPTLLAVSTLLTAVLGIMWLVLAHKGRRVRGLGYWGAAHLLFGCGTLLVGLRDVLPAPLSIDLGNGLFIAGAGACWTGARRFNDRRARLPPAMAGAVLWLLLRLIPALTDTVEARIVIVSGLTTAYILATAWEFSRRGGDPLLFRNIVVASFVLHGTLVLLRTLAPLVQNSWTATDGLPAGLWLGLAAVEAMVHLVLTNFALLAMIREREQQRAVAEIARSRDAADHANAAKSRFLARMSHELRTPLNGVLGLAQILAADRGLPEEARDHGAMIERTGRHLLALVNDVLDLAQVDAGKVAFEAQPVPLARLLDSAAVLLRPEAARKRILLEVELAPRCPPVVRGDELRLRQVLLNLLGNAVKFTPEGGRVRLELLPLPAPAGAPPPGIRLEVTDTGPGIPPDQRDLLFRDFSRMSRSGPQREGHGLGLAISAGLVEAMGGRIGVLPAPGGTGSRFWAELPLRAAPPPATPRDTARLSRILVVDEVALHRLVLQALLQPAGHTVTMAASGPEAIAALAGQRFDLVLLAAQMSGMDGLETARRIRAAENAAGRVPRTVLVALIGQSVQAGDLSADAMAREAQACLEAGMDAWLATPVDRARLLETVGQAIDGGATVRPPLAGAA